MVLDVGQEALWVTALLAAPLLISALVIGLLVGMVQAATQIQEMTLTFIPKLAVLGLALVVAGSWMLGLITDFSINLIERIPELIG
jgi:flagellar biosynthetic protein FliQ